MKRLFFTSTMILLLIGVVCEHALSQKPKARTDVRGVRWEMTSREVGIIERGKLIKKGKLPSGTYGMLYNADVAGIDCTVSYFFISKKLCRVRITSKQQYFGNKCIEDYDWLKRELQEKYGPPKSNLTFWRRKLYKETPDRHGFAVTIGDLVKSTSWETPTSTITLVLWEKRNESKVEIEYNSKTMKAAMKKAEDKRRRSSL